MLHSRLPPLLPYGIAILAFVAALLLTRLLLPLLDPNAYPLFYAAVAASAWYGGMGPGMVATVLSVVAIYFLVTPIYSFDLPDSNILVQLIGFLLVSFLITSLCSELRAAKFKAEASLKSLKESRKRFSQLAEANLIGVSVSDIKGAIVSANDAFLKMVGYSREDLLAGRIRLPEMTPPEYQQTSEQAIHQLITNGTCTPFEKEYIRKDGQRVPLLVGSTLLQEINDQPPEIIAFYIDLTERKRAEEALRESESRFRLMVESATDYAIFTMDLDGCITSWNSGATGLLGYQEAEIIGCNAAIIFTPEDQEQKQPEQERQQAMLCGRAVDERWHQRKDGSCFWASGLMTPLRDELDQIHGFLKILRDMTSDRKAQEEREELLARERTARADAEAANRIKDEFLAVLSHELRTPLNPILGWTRLLRSRKFDAVKREQALETIERNARLQTQLIEDLLDVSRILRGKLSLNISSVNLVPTITAAIETVRLAAEAKSISIQLTVKNSDSDITEIDIDSAPTNQISNYSKFLVSGDAGRLQQVLWNLLSNAVKFTPDGGRVNVLLEQVGNGEWEMGNSKVGGEKVEVDGDSGVEPGKDPELHPLAPSPSYVQITVTDTGTGISPKFLPHVFEYFRQADSATTRPFGGLGLGLAIVHHLVELHGGTVQAESPGEGKGATFTVRLPMLKVKRKSQKTSKKLAKTRLSTLVEKQAATLTGLQVLVVDDEADMREFLSVLLEEYEAKVTSVKSAGEALQAIMQSKPDVLLSDIGMPDMDGYMLMRLIRSLEQEQGSTIPAIALTAYASEIDYQQAIAAGFQQHLAKPIEPEKLISTIVSLIHSS